MLTGGITADSKVEDIWRVYGTPEDSPYYQIKYTVNSNKLTLIDMVPKSDAEGIKYSYYFMFLEDGTMQQVTPYVSDHEEDRYIPLNYGVK